MEEERIKRDLLIRNIMHPKEIEKVTALEPLDRYQYFIKKVADREVFYTLTNDVDRYATSEIDGNILLPLWSDKEYAELCKINGWENYGVQELDLDDLENSLIDIISEFGYLLNIFPVYERTGFVVDLDEFARDLSEELKNY